MMSVELIKQKLAFQIIISVVAYHFLSVVEELGGWISLHKI